MPSVIHSDQGREFENRIMQELCLLGGAHKTQTTPYHPECDGMVERFNRTLLMMLAMFAGKNRDDWDDLLPAVMMAYRSSVHESTGFSPYRLMFGEECTLPMDIGLPRDQLDTSESITSLYALWVRDAYIQSYIQSCTTCIARKSPCPRKVPMGHVNVGHRWERVAMDLLDMSVTTSRGNRYVLVMVDCFTRWTEAFPLPDKTAQSVADAFFNQVVCRFGMPSVIHSDQGREFENRIMQELCLLGGAHKTQTTPYHPECDGMVERFNRTLLMMLAMFAGKNQDDWDDLLPAVMMAYRSSVHESTGFSPYRLMFGEECTLPMDIGLPRDQLDTSESITSLYALWVRDALEETYDQVRQHSGQAVQRQKRLYDRRAVKRDFVVGDWVMRYYSPAKKCKLDSPWIGPYLIVSFMGWTIGIQKEPESPVVMVHCQDAKKIPPPLGAVSWLTSKESTLKPAVTILGASTMHRTMPNSLSMTMGLSVEDIAVAGEDISCAVGPSVHPSGSSQLDVTSATLISVSPRLQSDTAELDLSCVLHPFFVHKMDSGPVRLMTIAHAFNYRMAVLRDGVRSAVRVGRS